MANYNHPSYLTRQIEYVGATTAGNGTISNRLGFPTGMRMRRMTATVLTAGTSTGASVSLFYLNGTATTTVQTIVLGTNTANTIVQGTDANTLVPVGSVVGLVNGTDATAVASVVTEYTLDAQFGTFSNP